MVLTPLLITAVATLFIPGLGQTTGVLLATVVDIAILICAGILVTELGIPFLPVASVAFTIWAPSFAIPEPSA